MRRFGKIRVQLLAIVLVCYLVPAAVLGVYMGGMVLGDLQEKTEAALATGMEYSRNLAEDNLQKIVSLARDATYDGELTSAAAQRDSGRISHGEFLRLARNYIERKYSREGMLTFAACFTLDDPDLLLVNRSGYDAAMAYQAEAHEAVKAMSAGLDAQNRFVRLGGRAYLVRNLLNLRMKPYGMLVLGIDEARLSAPLQELAAVWEASLDVALDGITFETPVGDGETVRADWDAVPPGRIVRLDARHYALASAGRSRDYALRLGLIIGRERLYGDVDGFRLLLAGLVVLLIPILVSIAWYVYRRITRPIALLESAAQRIEAGELGVTVPMHGDDELGGLGRAFSNMSLRLEELIDRTYKEEIALRDARIQAMQSRINPHFINNALESINWQARLEGCESISAMVESLSVLLNAVMSRNNRRMVTLREELEVTRAYFYFVSLRFGDRLSTCIDVEPAVLEATVPVLTLQPLIENAVEHGIAPAGGGEITLRCAGTEAGLRMEVANSGKPASPEDRRHIEAALRGDNQEGAHLGLANISTRLHLIYGGHASIRAVMEEQGRTRVILDLPRDGGGANQGGDPA